MNDSHIYFLSGLPRAGSTLLGSILNQNPSVRVTPTSPLTSLLVTINEHLNYTSLQYTFDAQRIGDKIYQSVISAFYDERDRPVIFDKDRNWPKHVPAIRKYINENVRIICVFRPIAEIVASYLKLANADPSNFIDVHLKKDGKPITNESRANLLWTVYLKNPYEAMITGLKLYRESLLLVEYKDIVQRSECVLASIYRFCELPAHTHNLNNIENTCAEAKDEAWGMKNLHTIRPVLAKTSTSPYEFLSIQAIDYFSQFDLVNHGK